MGAFYRTVFSSLSLILWTGLKIKVCAGGKEDYLVPPAHLSSAPYAKWAHHHWVWLSGDRANQTAMISYAKDYMDKGVKVGAVVIDYGWSNGVMDFTFDKRKYPNASEMVQCFHSNNIKVVLWATSMVNTDSSNYNESFQHFVRNGNSGNQAKIKWWDGEGSLLDYTNSVALNWWHGQMNKVLDNYNIDGWKCNGSDAYIQEISEPKGKFGSLTRTGYSHSYYGDFFDYTNSKTEKQQKLIMSRAVAESPRHEYLNYSSKKVTFAGWVGDQDPDFNGLENALKRYLLSAWEGYANFGSDIGGYRNGDSALGRSMELLIRWAQLGAFSPLMENGGRMEHRPWMFNNLTLEIYTMFVDVHYELVPYLHTAGSEAIENERSSITPMATKKDCMRQPVNDFNPKTYNYLLGSDIFVAPVSKNTTEMSIKLPHQRSWMYWWNHSRVFSEAEHIHLSVPLEEYPVFLAEGSFIPLQVTQKSIRLPRSPISRFFLGADLWAEFSGYLRWLLYPPAANVEGGVVTKEVREESGGGIMASYWWPNSRHCLAVNITAHKSTKSLIHLAGLPHSLKELRVLTTGGGWWSSITEGVSSFAKLRGLAAGGYVQIYHGGYYHAIVNPAGNNCIGHSVEMCF